MICAMFVCMLFCLGGIALAIGAGVITFTFGMIGGIAKGICKLIGVLLMPIALMFAFFFHVGYLLPILVPVALILVVIGLLAPKRA
ncbi:MAG: hypothetical protein SPK07_08755 [Coriobacteriales bacterium]|nr:hypothetical protein [Coriobacteriales bacterium]